MSRHKRGSEQSDTIAELAHRRVGAVVACLKVLCPDADLRTQRQLASKILTLAHSQDHPVPRKMITPAAVYEMITRDSQCVLSQMGKCPQLVFSQQFCEELNSFLQAD